MSYHADLISDIDAFVERAGMSEITLGRKALGDPHFVRQLRNGRRVWPETERKVRDFMTGFAADADHAEASASEDDKPSTGQANAMSGEVVA